MYIDIWVMDIHNWIMVALTVQCIEIIASLTTFTHNSIMDIRNCSEFCISIIFHAGTKFSYEYSSLNYGYPLLYIYVNILNWIKLKFWQHHLMASLIYQGHEFKVLPWRVNIIFIGWSRSWPGHLMILLHVVNRDFLILFLIGWRLCSQPINIKGSNFG